MVDTRYNNSMGSLLNMVTNNPEDRKKIIEMLREYSNSMTRIEAERDLQKTMVSDLADKVAVEAKVLKQLASVYHKQNFAQVRAEQEDFQELYETIVLKG